MDIEVAFNFKKSTLLLVTEKSVTLITDWLTQWDDDDDDDAQIHKRKISLMTVKLRKV